MPRKTIAEQRAEHLAALANIDAKAIDRLKNEIEKDEALLVLDLEREKKAAAKVLARQDKLSVARTELNELIAAQSDTAEADASVSASA